MHSVAGEAPFRQVDEEATGKKEDEKDDGKTRTDESGRTYSFRHGFPRGDVRFLVIACHVYLTMKLRIDRGYDDISARDKFRY